jgi:hypothetical protein
LARLEHWPTQVTITTHVCTTRPDKLTIQAAIPSHISCNWHLFALFFSGLKLSHLGNDPEIDPFYQTDEVSCNQPNRLEQSVEIPSKSSSSTPQPINSHLFTSDHWLVVVLVTTRKSASTATSWHAVTLILLLLLLESYSNSTSKQLQCTVTVQEKFFWINLEVKGQVRWD